jgi:hypothetical protein
LARQDFLLPTSARAESWFRALQPAAAIWLVAGAAQAAFLWRGQPDGPVYPLYYFGYCVLWWLAVLLAATVGTAVRAIRGRRRDPARFTATGGVLVVGWMINLALTPVGFAVDRAAYHRRVAATYLPSVATVTAAQVRHRSGSGRHSSESWDPHFEFTFDAGGARRTGRGRGRSRR